MQRYLGTEEVAKILGLSDRMIRKYIKDEGLPAIRLKRRLRVGEDDLKEWLEKRKIGK